MPPSVRGNQILRPHLPMAFIATMSANQAAADNVFFTIAYDKVLSQGGGNYFDPPTYSWYSPGGLVMVGAVVYFYGTWAGQQQLQIVRVRNGVATVPAWYAYMGSDNGGWLYPVRYTGYTFPGDQFFIQLKINTSGAGGIVYGGTENYSKFFGCVFPMEICVNDQPI